MVACTCALRLLPGLSPSVSIATGLPPLLPGFVRGGVHEHVSIVVLASVEHVVDVHARPGSGHHSNQTEVARTHPTAPPWTTCANYMFKYNHTNIMHTDTHPHKHKYILVYNRDKIIVQTHDCPNIIINKTITHQTIAFPNNLRMHEIDQ